MNSPKTQIPLQIPWKIRSRNDLVQFSFLFGLHTSSFFFLDVSPSLMLFQDMIEERVTTCKAYLTNITSEKLRFICCKITLLAVKKRLDKNASNPPRKLFLFDGFSHSTNNGALSSVSSAPKLSSLIFILCFHLCWPSIFL